MNKHTIDIITSSDEEEPSFAMIADYEGSEENMFNVIDPNGETLPVLPVRNMVLFPGVVMPVTIGRSSSLKLVKDAYKKEISNSVHCQKSPETENPPETDLYDVGTAARIVRIFEMPDMTTCSCAHTGTATAQTPWP